MLSSSELDKSPFLEMLLTSCTLRLSAECASDHNRLECLIRFLLFHNCLLHLLELFISVKFTDKNKRQKYFTQPQSVAKQLELQLKPSINQSK